MSHIMRHLGIPSGTVPMWLMSDIGILVGLTFTSPAYADKDLLSWASDYEAASAKRAPDSTPELSFKVASPESLPLGSADIGIKLSGTAQLDAKGAAEVKVKAFIILPSNICNEGELTVEKVVDGDGSYIDMPCQYL